MKVLIIRLKYIGDTLLALPLCRSIKNSHPEIEVHYLMYESIAPLYRADSGFEPAIDQLQVITAEEKKHPLRYLQKLRHLRRQHYDVVIDTLTVPVTVLISRFTGARTTIGFDKGKWRSKWYSTRIPHVPNMRAAKQKLQLLRGMPVPVEPGADMALHFSARERRHARNRLAEQGIDLDRPVVLVSPIARIRSKLWPQEYFVELVERILDMFPVQMWIAWGPGEQRQAREIHDAVRDKDRLFCDLQTRDVREFAAIASQCALYVGNDSGPRHIAEAAGIPTFTIFSPTYSRHVWLPNPGDRHRAIDIADVLGIEFDEHLMNIPYYGAELQKYYKMITPQKALAELVQMLDQLVARNRDEVHRTNPEIEALG